MTATDAPPTQIRLSETVVPYWIIDTLTPDGDTMVETSFQTMDGRICNAFGTPCFCQTLQEWAVYLDTVYNAHTLAVAWRRFRVDLQNAWSNDMLATGKEMLQARGRMVGRRIEYVGK